jgi:hypothetical protein
MSPKIVFVALVLAAAPLAAAQQDTANPAREREITLRGCVMPALNDTYILTDVTPTSSPTSHSRQVLAVRRCRRWRTVAVCCSG